MYEAAEEEMTANVAQTKHIGESVSMKPRSTSRSLCQEYPFNKVFGNPVDPPAWGAF